MRYLACGSLALIRLVPEWQALVRETLLGPAQREPVELLEAAALEGVADDGDAGWIGACKLVEAGDGEEHILVRVERGVFGRRTREHARGGKEARGACQAQVRFAFGRCAVRGGVAPGR